MDSGTPSGSGGPQGDHGASAGAREASRDDAKGPARSLVGLGDVLVRTVRHFWPDLNEWLDDLPDTRWKPMVIYDRRFLTWWGLGLFLFKLGRRRALDYDLRDLDTCVLENFNRLAETEQDTLPVDGTLDHFLGHVGSQPFARIRSEMVRRLIRMRALDEARLEGRFVIAVDGTGWMTFATRHCDRCLWQKHGDTSVYFHMVEEAKLLGPSGLAISVATEFIENPESGAKLDPSSPDFKQDCELMALERLAKTLHREFPQLEICLSSDSLYGCGRAIAIAQSYGWSFVFTFKEGRMPAVWAEFQKLILLSSDNVKTLTLPDGTKQEYRWVNGLSYEDSEHQHREFNGLQCIETVGEESTRYAWITEMELNAANVVAIATKGGRARSRIENEGFNIQKNSDLNLEHPYSQDLERQKAYYYLLQIAHLILQLVEKGSLLRRFAERTGKSPMGLFGSLRQLARRMLDAFRYTLIPSNSFHSTAGPKIQIRFSTG